MLADADAGHPHQAAMRLRSVAVAALAAAAAVDPYPDPLDIFDDNAAAQRRALQRSTRQMFLDSDRWPAITFMVRSAGREHHVCLAPRDTGSDRDSPVHRFTVVGSGQRGSESTPPSTPPSTRETRPFAPAK
jgi:hypothetical protein